MIARRAMRELKIRADEPPVRDQHLQNQLNRLVGYVRRAAKHLKARDDVHRADAGFHRNAPVDAEARRIVFIPRGELKQKLFGVSLIARQQVCAAQRDQMVKTIEFPDHPHVSALSQHQRHTSEVNERPTCIRLRITMPIDLRSKIKVATEQRDSVIKNRVAFKASAIYGS